MATYSKKVFLENQIEAHQYQVNHMLSMVSKVTDNYTNGLVSRKGYTDFLENLKDNTAFLTSLKREYSILSFRLS